MKILKDNPIFYSLLGLCSALAVTKTLEDAFIMGITVMLILTLTNMIVSIFRKAIPQNIQIPAYILIISTLVTVVDIFLKENFSKVSLSLGIYIPLIIVNCLILGTAINYASKNTVIKSIKEGVITGLKFLLALIIIGFIRELLGTGQITIIDKLSSITNMKIIFKIPDLIIIPNSIFVSPAGAFLTLGIILIFVNKRGSHESN